MEQAPYKTPTNIGSHCTKSRARAAKSLGDLHSWH